MEAKDSNTPRAGASSSGPVPHAHRDRKLAYSTVGTPDYM